MGRVGTVASHADNMIGALLFSFMYIIILSFLLLLIYSLLIIYVLSIPCFVSVVYFMFVRPSPRKVCGTNEQGNLCVSRSLARYARVRA